MSRLLAVSWNAGHLRFVFAKSEKNGSLRVLSAGRRALSADDDQAAPNIAVKIQELIGELKAGRSRLLLCLNRGMIDAATFAVPPATDDELPVIVNNLAQRELPGLSADGVIDYVALPPDEHGSRNVIAMALHAGDIRSVTDIVSAAGSEKCQAILATCSLRIFASPKSEGDHTASLVISSGDETAQILAVQDDLPILTRTIRLPPEMKPADRVSFVASEVTRTLLSDSRFADQTTELSEVVVVGSEIEAAPLINEFQGQFPFEIRRVSTRSLIDGDAGEASMCAFAPLVAALKEEALNRRPAIDFLNPRRPPPPARLRNRILAAATVAALLVGCGWYYVHSTFAELQQENTSLKSRLAELDELVGETRAKRNRARVLDAWQKSRLCWLDELRDITVRMPSSPQLAVQQFSATSSGSGFVVSFQGTSRSPEAVRQMEDSFRDQYHELRTPGIRERTDGKQSVWDFQTTMQVRSRPKDRYLAVDRTTRNAAPAGDRSSDEPTSAEPPDSATAAAVLAGAPATADSKEPQP
ncbi:MAG: hypothetical protein R3C19_15835 [Planctomycetaceae bacterium]